MHVGSYQQLVDTKGRIILPGAFRQAFGKSFTISAGFDRCLNLWRTEDFETFVAKELSRTELSDSARRIGRWFHAHAHSIELDSQFRFVVPPPLREMAKLRREIVVSGAGNRVEIWDRAEWERYMNETTGSIEQIAESLSREHPI